MNIDDYMNEMEELTKKISSKKNPVHTNGTVTNDVKDRIAILENEIKNMETLTNQFVSSSRSFAAKIESIEERMDDIEQLQSSQVEKLDRLPALIKKLEELADGDSTDSLEDTRQLLKNAIDVLESISKRISDVETRMKKIEQKPSASKPTKQPSNVSDFKTRLLRLKKSY